MYKLSVPVGNINFLEHTDREKAMKLMKEMGVERVFLALGTDTFEGESKKSELDALCENGKLLRENGFEVGAWFWTFLSRKENGYRRMMSPDGRTSRENICPSDENYCMAMFSFLKEVADTPIDMIMFDDDFRYGFYDIGFGCLCENHYKKIREILGKNPARETVADGILKGGENEYRNAFLKANGEYFEKFAADCRKAVDSVNPSIRMGFCSCITSWDIDGTTPDRISRLLAGNTKPFYRLIGAPYWAALNAWGNRLSYVIEQERIESSRRKDKNIEIFSEGDTFPRPRHRVPAAYLEGMDTALRADGTLDGILKYSFDYNATLDYESGYNAEHMRNIPLYKKISELFDGKQAAGLKVIDNPEKFRTTEMDEYKDNPVKVQETAFCAGARFAAANSIPTTYGETGCAGIAFGEDARAVTEADLKTGLILDFAAAKILKSRGIDTGYIADNGEAGMNGIEYFANGEKIGILCSPKLHNLKLNEKAEELSFADKEKSIPVSYYYENADNEKFLVYTYDGYRCDDEAFRNYERQKQVLEAVKRMNGKGVPVSCSGHPDLYILAKQSGNRLSVGLWNFFPDRIYSPKLAFAENVKLKKIFGASGEAGGNTVTLSDIEPYGIVILETEIN